MSKTFEPVMENISDLKPHPRNYRDHPEDQLAHIIKSIEENGFYRNVVIAKDKTILAGHGVVKAAHKMGKRKVPTYRVPFGPDDPRAIKILVGDNQIGQLGMVDDRALTEMLKEVNDIDELLGTGYNEQMLAALVMVTRTADEIADFDAAAEWVGMPDYEPGSREWEIRMKFRSAEDRDEFIKQAGVKIAAKYADKKYAGEVLITAWWPPVEHEDVSSVKWETDA
jgi:hypothetical protein